MKVKKNILTEKDQQKLSALIQRLKVFAKKLGPKVAAFARRLINWAKRQPKQALMILGGVLLLLGVLIFSIKMILTGLIIVALCQIENYLKRNRIIIPRA